MKKNIHSLYHLTVKKFSIVSFILGLAIFSNFGFGQIVLISPTGDGGFETGTTFAANGWTESTQPTTSFWEVGTAATAYAGTRGVYVANPSGTYSYNTSASKTSHFYRDIIIPSGATNITLSFYWKGNGESGYDRALVYTAPTTITPIKNVPASSSTTLTGAALVWTQPTFAQSTYTLATITLPDALAGTTVRLIFTWQNDNLSGTTPGTAVDNISLTYIAGCTQPTTQATIGAYTNNNTGNSLTTNWARGNGNNVLVVARLTATTAVAPSSGTTYTANTAFGSGNTTGTGNFVVYNGTGTSVNVTALTAGSGYTFDIYEYNTASTCYKTPASSSAVTVNCANQALTYSQGFNAATIPGCWTQQYVVGTSNIQYVASNSSPTTTPQEGADYVYWNSYSITSGNITRLVSPPITTTGTSSVDVEFYWMHDPGYTTSADGVYVEYSTDGTSWTTVGTIIPRYDATLTGWNKKTKTLPAGAGNQSTIYVGFKFVSQNGNNCSMDAVVVKPSPSCLPPTAVTSSSVTKTTATISWTASTSNPISGYEYEVRTSGLAGSGATGLTTSGTTAAGVVTKAITGLTANTPYSVYVRSNCGGSDYSSWTTPAYTFTTLKIEPTNQPTNFAAGTVTTTAIPLTWTAAVAGSQLPDGYLVKLSTVDLATIASPVDGTDPANVTAITANVANKEQTTGTTTSTTSFTGMTAGTMYYYKIFSYTNSGTGIDFNTTSAPTLHHATLPTAVTTTTLTPNTASTATITWSNAEYNSGNWQTLVFVKAASSITAGTPSNNPTSCTANTIFGSGTAYQNDAAAYCVYNGDGASVSITGLSAATTYYVTIYTVVAASNSNSTNSHSSSSTTSATTPCAIYPLTYTQDFNASTSTPACWTTDMSVSATHGNSSSNGLYKNLWSSSSTCYARTPQVGPLTATSRITFDYRIVNYTSYPATATTLGASDKIEVQVSTDDVTYSTIYTINSGSHATSTSFANKQISLGTYSGSNVYVKLVGTWGAGDYFLDIDNVVIENSITPMISVSSFTTFGNQCINTTSVEKNYIVSGSNLTNNITITPPTGYEISTGTGGSFVATNPITLTRSGGSVANTNIYVRFKPTAVQAYTGNITHVSSGATSQNVGLSGSGVNSTPTITTPTSASVLATTAVLGGNITATGCSNISERGIYWSVTSGFADGTGTKVSVTAGAPYSAGVFTINVSGLSANTVYYYKAFTTNSAGTVYTSQETFTTPCAAFNPPYIQDFASYVPSCWNEATGALAPTTTLTTGSSAWTADGFANSGSTGAARIDIWSTGTTDWLVSPAVNLVAGNNYQLEFDLALTDYGSTSVAETDGVDDKFAVVISTDGGATWSSANTLMLWDNDNSTNTSNNRVYNDISNTSTRMVIPLSAYTGQTIRIGFYGESTVSNADNDLFIDNFVILAIAIPNCATQTAPANAATDICPGDGATLTWTKAVTGCTASDFIMYFGTNNPPTNLVNGVSIGDVTTYNTGPLVGNTAYYWKVQPATSVGTNTTCSSVFSFVTSNVSTPTVTSPVTTCSNTATLSATGSSLYWYDVPTGGSSIGTGNTYNATFNGNTTYYVASQVGASGSNYTVGPPTWNSSDGYFGTDDWGACFTTSVPLTVNSVEVYVQTAGSDVSVQFVDGTGTAVGSVLTFTSLPAGLNTLSLNTTFSTPGNYRLYSKNSTNLGRGSTGITFPYTQSGVMSVTSSWNGSVSTFTNYFFYNFKITTGSGSCQSARVPIVVNHTAEEIVITPSGPTTFDQGGSVDLTASSTHTPAYNFTWVPTAGLNTTTGANVTATPSTSTTYTVTGNNGGCTRTATIDINVILPCTGLGTGVTSISSLPYTISGQTTSGKVDDITALNATVCSSSSYYEDADVVYVFKPLVSGSVTISLTSPSTWSGLMLYKGCPMGGQGGVCASSSQSSTGDKSMCVNVEANENYYLVIDSYNTSNYIDYALSISAPNPGSTPNDLPCDAAPVSIGGIVAGDNTCASGSGEPTKPSCWSSTGSINTLWYSIVAPASGSLKIRTLLGSLTNTQMALYQGTCNSLSLVTNGCNDDFTICSITSKQSDLSLTGLTSGATYFLAVDGYGDEVGTFSVMVIDGANNWAPVPQQDCSSATVVCHQSTDVGNPGFVGSGNICDFSTSYGCLSSGEKNSAWYTINILNAGDFIFTITPINSSTDYDWGLFNVTGVSNPCSVINANTTTPLVRCSFAAGGGATGLNGTAVDASEGSGGDRWCSKYPALAGDVLMLNISNYSSNNSGFNLDMVTSPVNYNQPSSVTWTGATDSDWFKPANWGGCAIPSCTIDAVIVNGPAYQPVINAAGAACKNLQVINGASLTINAGRNLQMCGNFENLGVLNISPTASITMDNGSTVQALNGSLTGTNKLGNLVVNKTGGEVTANQNVEIGGNLTTSSATSLFNTNGKEIIVGGNVALNSPSTFGSVGTTGILKFNGISAQTYTPNGALTLHNVVIQNSSTGVTLNSDLILGTAGALTLNSGVFHTSTNKVSITNTDPNAVSGSSAGSYIDGNIRRHFASNTGLYSFPVGTSSAYRLAQLTNNSLVGVTYIDGKFTSSFPNTGSLNGTIAIDFGTPYTSFATEGIWTLTPDVQPSGGSYGINLWFNGGGSNPFSGLIDNAFGPLKRTNAETAASVWSSQGGSLETAVGRLVADGYARRDGWNSFSEFGIGKTTGALPVTLLSAYLQCEKEIVLSWSTVSELNNNYFTILKSENAIDFQEVARISGAGNSNTTINYQWKDSLNGSDKANYYQLQQTDFNGETKTISLLTNNCNNNSNGDIVLISNPNNPFVEAQFRGDKNGKYHISIINNLGQMLIQKEINLDTEGNVLLISKKGLASGIYSVVFKNAKEVITKQVLVTY